MSSKDLRLSFLTILERTFFPRAVGDFGLPVRFVFSTFSPFLYRFKNLLTVLLFNSNILQTSAAFIPFPIICPMLFLVAIVSSFPFRPMFILVENVKDALIHVISGNPKLKIDFLILSLQNSRTLR